MLLACFQESDFATIVLFLFLLGGGLAVVTALVGVVALPIFFIVRQVANENRWVD